MSLNYPKRTSSLVDAGKAPFPPPTAALTYEPFFGLNEKPFSLIADSRFVYDSPTYVATFDSLLAGIRRREGLLVLTGQIGTGKTTLCRAVLEELGRNTYSSLVPDPFASREDLLKMMLIDFGVLSIQELTAGPLRQASRTELGYLLSEFLNSLSRDAFVIVVIDEAQNLSLPLIEETRILGDTFGARGRLQIVFAGQPELHAKLKSPEMRQVDQRVCGYHRLDPLSRDAVSGYIQHRLQVAGGQPDRMLFAPAIVDRLHQRSGGVPRLINRICDRALQVAFERQASSVDRAILDTALLEVGSATLSPTWDSIMFAEPAPAVSDAAAIQAAPAVESAPAAPLRPEAVPPPIKDEGQFKSQVDQWVEQDLATPARTPTPPPPRESRQVPRQQPARELLTRGKPDRRFETRLQKIRRVWTKRAAIAFAILVGINLAMVGVGVMLNAFSTPVQPGLPAPPARALPAIALAAAPLAEPVVPAAAPSAAAEEYLVTVGLFSSTERADQLADLLTQAGLPAMQRTVEFRGRPTQQIVLGPFLGRADAAADLQRLQALGGHDDARVIDARAAQ